MKTIQLLITIAAYMNDTHGTRRLGGDKIALLGLFVVALLTARLIVASKSALRLSEPIRLSDAGLSVSMPAGNGWQNQKQWRRLDNDNGFMLSSSFAPGSRKPTATVICQYLLAAEPTAPQMRFEQKAVEVGAVVVRADLMQTDTLVVDWAHVTGEEMPLTLFLGTARLPDNRQLDIEVYEITGNAELAERVFKRIVNSLKFEDGRR